MSLQAKFTLLLASLAAAVLLALGTAWWALGVTYREVREPVRTSSRALAVLVKLEQVVDELRGLADPGDAFSTSPRTTAAGSVDSPPPTALSREAYLARRRLIDARFDELVAETSWSEYAGRSPIRNLRVKFDTLRQTADAHFDGPPAPAGDASPPLSLISNQLFDIHELLKRIEGRIVTDIRDLTDSSADLRTRLIIVLALALLLVLLTGALATALVRRWVVHPVGLLRAAAARIAAGDFEHRVPIAPNAPADEMTALSAEVNHMAGMVKQLQSERIEQERLAAVGEMVRRLAHNLRNPLAGIRGLAELTRSDVSNLGEPAADVRENQTRIITTVDRFESWLADLLRVTRPSVVEPTPHDVGPWLTGLVAAHRPFAQSLAVQLFLDLDSGPERATFDPRHLEHAVSAILSNAIQAAKQNESARNRAAVRVTSQVRKPADSPQVWELRIADSGAGVPQNLRGSVFKPYFTTKQDGNGIGLAIALQAVRGHGGDIRIEDTPGGLEAFGTPDSGAQPHHATGAVFVIRLPLAISEAGEDQSLANIGQQGASLGSDSGHRR
ncbi:MAG: HAMP domain-containing histidine kinase [Phycisphaerales bacterium]|nr:HAMP domain-containing histidine kinase [Phycisphaerales bacterium]